MPGTPGTSLVLQQPLGNYGLDGEDLSDGASSESDHAVSTHTVGNMIFFSELVFINVEDSC